MACCNDPHSFIHSFYVSAHVGGVLQGSQERHIFADKYERRVYIKSEFLVHESKGFAKLLVFWPTRLSRFNVQSFDNGDPLTLWHSAYHRSIRRRMTRLCWRRSYDGHSRKHKSTLNSVSRVHLILPESSEGKPVPCRQIRVALCCRRGRGLT